MGMALDGILGETGKGKEGLGLTEGMKLGSLAPRGGKEAKMI